MIDHKHHPCYTEHSVPLSRPPLNEQTFFSFAHDLVRVAEELAMRAGSPPVHMPMTLAFARFLERHADQTKQRMSHPRTRTYHESRIDTALRHALVWRMYVQPETPGNPRDSAFVQVLYDIALDLSFLAQRGYKVDRQAIRNYAELVKDCAPRIASTPALGEKLRRIG